MQETEMNDGECIDTSGIGLAGVGKGAAWMVAGGYVKGRDSGVSAPPRKGTFLPLSPPGRGGGSKPAPELTAGGFRAAMDRTDPSLMDDTRLKAWDIRKLEAVVELELTEGQEDAFFGMLDTLRRPGRTFPLTERQREWIDSILEKNGEIVDPPEPEPELRGFRR